MTLKLWELISIVFSAFVTGMFGGPWIALSRSLSTFKPEVFLAIAHRMNRNMAPVMTILMPAALLSIVPVLFISHRAQQGIFYLDLTGLALFIVALLVTVLIEVPIVTQIMTWTASTLPANWQQLRDRWGAFHVIRVAVSIVGLVLLVAGAVYARDIKPGHPRQAVFGHHRHWPFPTEVEIGMGLALSAAGPSSRFPGTAAGGTGDIQAVCYHTAFSGHEIQALSHDRTASTSGITTIAADGVRASLCLSQVRNSVKTGGISFLIQSGVHP